VSSFSSSSGVQMIGLASPALSSTPKTLGRIRRVRCALQQRPDCSVAHEGR
jgi:hypothetical protein